MLANNKLKQKVVEIRKILVFQRSRYIMQSCLSSNGCISTAVQSVLIAMAISFSSWTAEWSFSSLKRIETRRRSTMLQDAGRVCSWCQGGFAPNVREGLLLMSVNTSEIHDAARCREILLLMSVEREIPNKLQNDSIIDKFARSSSELSRALLHDI